MSFELLDMLKGWAVNLLFFIELNSRWLIPAAATVVVVTFLGVLLFRITKQRRVI